MAVPYTFGSATTSIPLSQLDSNFATTITLGNTAVQLGNTITSLTGVSNVASATSLSLGSNGNTTAITVDTSQLVGIGTTSPNSYGGGLVVRKSNTAQGVTNATAQFSDATNSALWVGHTSGATNLVSDAALTFGYSNGTTTTERMRIDSSGYVLINKTTATSYGGINAQAYTVNSSGQKWLQVWDSTVAAGSCQGLYVIYSAATPNNTANEFIFCGDQTSQKFLAMSNGGLKNYSTNNSNLSDQREKKDIALAPNYLDKICQIPVKTFLLNNQTDEDLNLGVIAQDVQAICPELVTESDWGTKEEPKMRLSIYQTDLQYALMKSIQELKAINDTQAETINALTARIVALEAK
jgi:Chaperone of endosialidase